MATYPSPKLQNLTVNGIATLTDVSSAAATITGGTIDGTPIGATTPASVHATTINSTGAATLASVSTASATLTGGTVDGVTIGGTTPDAIHATTLNASGTVSGAGFTTLLSPYSTSATLAGTAVGDGAYLIGYQNPSTGSVAETVQAKLQQTISAKDFGAIGDGNSHPLSGIYGTLAAAQAVYPFVTALTQELDYAAIQAAINSCAEGGVVMLRQDGHYLINTGLSGEKGVFLKGETNNDDTSNTNGSGAGFPRITWNGSSSSGAMFTLQSATVGNAIWGGGTRNVYWDGAALIATAVYFNNTVSSVFNGDVRNVTTAGLVINSDNGTTGNFSQSNIIERMHFVWGTATACQNAHAISMSGNGSTVPATQQQVWRCDGLVYNGFMLYIAETDNCYAESVNADTQSGGTGGAVYLKAGGAQNPNFCVFNYLNGVVKQENGIAGTTILHYISEGGGIYQVSGSSVWHGDLVDYVTDRRFASHTYALSKKIQVNNAMWLTQGSTMAPVAAASQWYCIAFPNAGVYTASAVFAPDFDCDVGSISAIELRFISNGTSAGTAQFEVSLSSCADGSRSAIITPQATVTVNPTVAAQYTSFEVTATLGTPLATANGDTLFISLQRQNAGTNTDAILLLSARIIWTGVGPNSSGSGTYYIPSW